MTRRQIVTVFGFLILVLTPLYGEIGSAFRLFAGACLFAVGTVEFFARVPVKGMLWLLRLLSLAIGLFVVLCLCNFPKSDRTFSLLLAGFGAPFFVLPLAASLKRKIRDRIYTLCIWGGCFALALLMAQTLDGLSLIGLPAGYLLALQIALTMWRKTPAHYVETRCTEIQASATKTLANFDDVSLRAAGGARRFAEIRLFGSMAGLRLAGFGSAELFAQLDRMCRQYPKLGTSWQLAYSAHMEVGDFARAADVLIEARAHGFTDSYFDRALARALYLGGNNMWREVLDQGWEKACDEGMGQNRFGYFSFDDDPTEFWRDTDPLYDRLRSSLGLAVRPGLNVATVERAIS